MFVINTIFKLVGVILVILAFVALYQPKAKAVEPQSSVLTCEADRTVQSVLEKLANNGLGFVVTHLTEEKASKFYAALVKRLGPPPITYTPDAFLVVMSSFSTDAYIGLVEKDCLREVYALSPVLLREIIAEAQE